MNVARMGKGVLAIVALLGVVVGSAPVRPADIVQLGHDGTNAWVRIFGDDDHDWRLQTSIDCTNWSVVTGLGALLSQPDVPAWRSLGPPVVGTHFFRAVRTEGLFDTSLVRTIRLTFPQRTWQGLLTTARTTGGNVPGSLAMDNGATVASIGGRFKGNTSFTGFGSGVPTKKSLNLEIDYTNLTARLLGFKTLNLNNAYGDETIFRETLYFNVMRQYTVCPHAMLMKLYINDAYWGVYSGAQQQDGDLIAEYFPSRDGDRWRAPNAASGGFESALSALSYLGTNINAYRSNYELKDGDPTNAWVRLAHACDVLNNTPTNQLRDEVEEVLAVDRWLWFLALENVFADEDSYYAKGADYMFYYEPESGRIHPVEHDGNEALTPADASLSPVQGATASNRPVLRRLLSIPELRQRYLAHMRTVLTESFNPTVLNPVIAQYVNQSVADVAADPKKTYTMTAYTNDLVTLRTFIAQRFSFLMNHAELRPLAPVIGTVRGPTNAPAVGEQPFVTAEVKASGTNGVDSVWLWHRGQAYGRFAPVAMADDGQHADGAANDGVYGAAVPGYPAAAKVRFYVEARSANPAKAAAFAPPRAEQQTYSYRVALSQAAQTPVVINEFMAANAGTLADPQGEYDDWIELRNVTDQEVDLSGWYLSDEPGNPRKWTFPAGTRIPADGYLLVWADEDGTATPGMHASFKLAAGGEELFLNDRDDRLNAVLDHVSFGLQSVDVSYGRSAENADVWSPMTPTPGGANR